MHNENGNAQADGQDKLAEGQLHIEHRQITRTERSDLLRVARMRGRVAKTSVDQRAAELVADFERQLASIYHWDQDETWREARKRADAALKEAQDNIADRCRELGIPRQFAPGLVLGWYGRGENATASRRAELRKVAQTRIEARKRAAYSEIENRSAQIQTELLAIGMSSEAARLLESMPSAEKLMPPISVSEAELLLIEQDPHR